MTTLIRLVQHALRRLAELGISGRRMRIQIRHYLAEKETQSLTLLSQTRVFHPMRIKMYEILEQYGTVPYSTIALFFLSRTHAISFKRHHVKILYYVEPLDKIKDFTILWGI